MNEIKSEIMELLEYSTLLDENNKKIIISQVMNSSDYIFLNPVLLKLKNENNHIINFLKDLVFSARNGVSIQEIKQEMTRTYLQDMKIKEILLITEDQKDIESILTQIA